MTTAFQAPKGVAEYVPPDSSAFLAVRNALARPAVLAGYGYVELPVFEDTELFVRGVGESTDVVSKEMYTFTDRGDRSITLRPEGTAGVVRAAIEHRLDRGQLPVKLWYAGPFFRAERPQHGRYRQFFQVGLEALGSDDPALDAEVVATAAEGFRALGLTQVVLHLTSLGDAETRPAYREKLQEFLRGCDLDDDTRRRAEINPLRVLDDKREQVQRQLADAPLMRDSLSPDARAHYDEVREHLRALGVAWTEAPRLVRGLDYYTRTTFEFEHPLLGSQSAIGGGGRYDGLMASLGGQELSGIGFGLGIDRTLLACRAEGLPVGEEPRVDAYLVPLGPDAKRRLVALAGELRAAGVRTDLAYGDRGVKGAMKGADRSGARVAVLVGDRDLAAGVAQVKDLGDTSQEAVPFDALVQHIRELCQNPSERLLL